MSQIERVVRNIMDELKKDPLFKKRQKLGKLINIENPSNRQQKKIKKLKKLLNC